ncbi:MAG: deaminase [Rhodoferax sp.]|nr:deaminase [Rhodoferax sp.]
MSPATAETNCIQSFMQRTQSNVPDDSTLYTTLQSCEMCAGMLTTVAQRMRVVYGAADKGIGITALSHRINGAREEPFLHGASDPIARANFQRIVAQSMVRTHQENVTNAAKIARGMYAATIPRPSMKDLSDTQRATVGQQYTQRQNRVGNILATFAFGSTSAGFNMNRAPLPNAVTSALSSAPSMANIAVYRRLYSQLGMMMVTRQQCRPDRDHMGFTVTEIRRLPDGLQRHEQRYGGQSIENRGTIKQTVEYPNGYRVQQYLGKALNTMSAVMARPSCQPQRSARNASKPNRPNIRVST